MSKSKRLLMITDHHYISALLFHGFGLPPWYDLPRIQENSSFRAAMTEHVNRVVELAAAAGFTAFDIHEAFPVDLMRLTEGALLIRGIDRFLIERRYAGYALLVQRFEGLKRQPRLGLLRELRLNNRPADEADLIVVCMNAWNIPLVYSEINARKYMLGRAGSFGAKLLKRKLLPVFPMQLSMQFDPVVPVQRYAGQYPGVTNAGVNWFSARVRSPEQLMELYSYAGVLITEARRY